MRANTRDNRRGTYGNDGVRRLAFIRYALELGFEPKAVRNLLPLQEQPERLCKTAASLAATELAVVERKIHRLKRLRHDLERMAKSSKNGCVAECRVIEATAK
mgnify:FL=1